jgi:ribosomal protein S18 acetylase RimI-like enzyme
VVRRYRHSDAAAVLDLHHSALAHAGADAGPGPWDADLEDVEGAYLATGGEFLVGVLGSRLVAMGALRRLDPHTLELKRMRVDPAYQRQGYGRRVLQQLLDRADELGCDQVTLDTSPRQTAAIALYRQYGFEQTGTGTVAGMDALFFRRSA